MTGCKAEAVGCDYNRGPSVSLGVALAVIMAMVVAMVMAVAVMMGVTLAICKGLCRCSELTWLSWLSIVEELFLTGGYKPVTDRL